MHRRFYCLIVRCFSAHKLFYMWMVYCFPYLILLVDDCLFLLYHLLHIVFPFVGINHQSYIFHYDGLFELYVTQLTTTV